MRVLHVMATCSQSSGVAQVVMRFYREMHKEIVFDFLLYRDVQNSFIEEIISLGGEVFYTGKPNLKSLVHYIRQINEFFEQAKGKYDIVHLHEVYLNPIILRIAKQKGVEVRIAHSHTTKLSDTWKGAIRNRILYMPVKRYANAFFACSKEAGIVAFGNNIIHSNFFVVNNAINIKDFVYAQEARVEIRNQLGIKDSDIVIGHIGRFAPQKNHKLIVAVFNELQKQNNCVKLMLVGEGTDIVSVREQCSNLQLDDKVYFLGARKDVGMILSAMDVFFFPSLYEGLGVALIEAQCNGLPCVVSDVVPKEAEVLSNYKTVALHEDMTKWVEALNESMMNREDNADRQVERAGYNISVEATKLKEIYKLLRKGFYGGA